MAMPDDDFIDRSGAAILRGKLALFNGPLDVKVVDLLEPEGHGRQIPVERQVVPICALLPLFVAVLEAVALAQTDIGYGSS
jgi:hypothetical protein